MSTATQNAADLVVEIPSDVITLGHDADGLPRTDAVNTELPKKADGTPDIDAKDIPDPLEAARKKAEEELGAKWREERTKLERERDDRAREAREAAEHAAAEKAAREKAEADSLKNTDIAMRAHWTTLNTRKEQFEAGLANTKMMIDTIKREIRQAQADGNSDSLADLYEKLAEAKNHEGVYSQAASNIANEIEETRRAFAAREEPVKEPAKVEKKVEEPKTVTPDDWIEGVKTVVGNDGTDWLKAHKEYVTDPKLHKKLLRFADEYADDNGQSALKSGAFVEALNAKFFPQEEADDVAEEVETKPAPKTKAKATPAAPVSRSESLFSSSNPNAKQVRLPPKLAAFVKASGLDPTEYALGAVADIKAGKLPKNFLDPDYPHEF